MTRLARPRERGQGLAEAGIVLLLFVTLTMGTLEFGRAWMIANMITHAARDGARIGAALPASQRDVNGMFTSTSSIQNQVLTEIQNVVPTSGFTVDVTQPTTNGVPLVQVQVNATVPYMFNLVGTSFAVARTATFRDEGR